MSEYQYYEFQAIDRSLSEAEREALRELSTRARITATSFTNHYEWGDFKGDPKKLMERWFDLHLYLANWGTRQLMIRLPKRLVDRRLLDAFLGEVEDVTLWTAGDNLILNIVREEVESEDWDDGSGWLATLAPLRADVLGGDLRLFYLVWLMAVEADVFEPDEPEPMPGIGPLTGPLEAFADFFGIDRDLVAAAAEHTAALTTLSVPSKVVRPIITAMTDQEKTSFLTRLFEGDAHVAGELRALVRDRLASETAPPPVIARTVGELRARANALRLAREKAEAAKTAAERKQREEEAERARRARLDAIERRGESVWQEIETEIERRNSAGYDKAAALLADLRVIAEARGSIESFASRLERIRERHARKERFIGRLAKLR
jgi:hypothetical protein